MAMHFSMYVDSTAITSKKGYFVIQMLLPYSGEDMQGLHSEESVPLGGKVEEKADSSSETAS